MQLVKWKNQNRDSFILEDNIHVWCIRLDLPINCFNEHLSLLSEDELSRADRYVFDKDRNYFVNGRGQVRILLAKYLSRNPASIQLGYNEYGKPFLMEHLRKPLHFSFSNSNNLALLAVTNIAELGIDLEYMRPEVDFLKIAERFFSKHEQYQIKMLADDEVMVGFYNCWTRKESYIKARGRGFSIPLDQFDVSLIPGQKSELIEIRHENDDHKFWTLSAFLPELEYVGALAIRSRAKQFCFWNGRSLSY